MLKDDVMDRIELEEYGGAELPRNSGQQSAPHAPAHETAGSPRPAAISPADDKRAVQPAGTSPPRRRRVAAIIIPLIIIGGLIIGFLPRWRQHRAAIADMNQLAIPTVSVVSPAPGKPGDGLVLPAEIRPWREASIYARANGYLKDWVADIGAHVQAGQLLAEIETPDLDQQLEQAKAQLDLAQANLHLAETTDDRWKELLKTASVSEQAAAEKAAAR
jgi:multidrug efflux pump subunit AcrA (membrane-fusion protein)